MTDKFRCLQCGNELDKCESSLGCRTCRGKSLNEFLEKMDKNKDTEMTEAEHRNFFRNLYKNGKT